MQLTAAVPITKNFKKQGAAIILEPLGVPIAHIAASIGHDLMLVVNQVTGQFSLLSARPNRPVKLLYSPVFAD